MLLTDTKIKNAKPTDKTQRLSDGDGLYMLLTPTGAKWWRFDYTFNGKRNTLGVGTYPEVSLKQAREQRAIMRSNVAAGIDPSEHRKATKNARADLVANSFETIALEWYARQASVLGENTKVTLLARLQKDVLPWIGEKPIGDINAPDIVALIKRIDDRGAHDVAKRMLRVVRRIFSYAISHGKCVRNPAADVNGRDLLTPVKEKHHAAVVDPKEVGALLRAIDAYSGGFITRCALKLAPLTFVRPGELRQAEWTEFDFDKAEWRIPAERMKMKEQHIVPLSRQAVDVLREIEPLTGRGRFVFPGERTRTRPMSENTITAALRRMGYSSDEMTGHGFRSTASTLLHELGYMHQAIEAQLAHGDRNRVAAAYNHAKYLDERRVMMQEWADYLDTLRKVTQTAEMPKAA